MLESDSDSSSDEDDSEDNDSDASAISAKKRETEQNRNEKMDAMDNTHQDFNRALLSSFSAVARQLTSPLLFISLSLLSPALSQLDPLALVALKFTTSCITGVSQRTSAFRSK